MATVNWPGLMLSPQRTFDVVDVWKALMSEPCPLLDVSVEDNHALAHLV